MTGAFGSIDLSTVEDPNTAVTIEQFQEIVDRGCPRCGTQVEPEPTEEERAKIIADADYQRARLPGPFIELGFGLLGGGYGPWLCCDGCGLLAKHDLGPDAE